MTILTPNGEQSQVLHPLGEEVGKTLPYRAWTESIIINSVAGTVPAVVYFMSIDDGIDDSKNWKEDSTLMNQLYLRCFERFLTGKEMRPETIALMALFPNDVDVYEIHKGSEQLIRHRGMYSPEDFMLRPQESQGTCELGCLVELLMIGAEAKLWGQSASAKEYLDHPHRLKLDVALASPNKLGDYLTAAKSVLGKSV